MNRKELITRTQTEKIVNALVRKIDLKSIYQITQDHFNMMVRHDGSSHLSVLRNPDGTLSLEPPDVPWDEEEETEAAVENIPVLSLDKFVNSLKPWTNKQIRNLLRRQHPAGTRITDNFMREHYSGSTSIEETSSNSIYEAMMEATGGTSDGGPALWDLKDHIYEEWDKFSGYGRSYDVPDTVNIQLDKFSLCTLAQHNAFTRHGETILDASAEAPLIAMIWWNYMTRLDPQPPDPATVPEMAWTIRNQMGMTPAQWRTFMKIAPMSIQHPYQCEKQQDIDELKTTTAAITQTNVKDYCPVLATFILREDAQSLIISQLAPAHPSHWKAWVWAIRQTFLDHALECQVPGTPEYIQDRVTRGETLSCFEYLCYDHAQVLLDIGHALTWHAEHGHPWRNTNYLNLLRQSREWLVYQPEGSNGLAQVIDDIHEDDHIQYNQNLEWHSLLEPQNILGLDVIPITNTKDLNIRGKQMKNCLPSMATQLLTGKTRIFILQEPNGPLVAAGEIRATDQRWRLGEVRGPENSPAPANAREAMQEVARIYQEAQHPKNARNQRTSAAPRQE